MKTINDLQKMKKTPCMSFDNSYEFFILTLQDYYLANKNGINKIYKSIQDWDSESKNLIVNDLIHRIKASGIKNFDESEFRKKLLG